MPKGTSSTMFNALNVDVDQKPIELKQHTEELSLRQLTIKGDYEQVCIFLPREMKTKLKMLEAQRRGQYMSHFVKEALELWFEAND